MKELKDEVELGTLKREGKKTILNKNCMGKDQGLKKSMGINSGQLLEGNLKS